MRARAIHDEDGVATSRTDAHARRRGKRVAIYADPLTREIKEGEAHLREWLSSDPATGTERWLVHFVQDPMDEEYERVIAMPAVDLRGSSPPSSTPQRTTMSTWYRGYDGDAKDETTWYVADPWYAAFFGSTISEIEVPVADVLDLTAHGTGSPDQPVTVPEGMPAHRHETDEIYQYAERRDVQEAARSLGYRGIRVMQWSRDFSGDAQDTLLVL